MRRRLLKIAFAVMALLNCTPTLAKVVSNNITKNEFDSTKIAITDSIQSLNSSIQGNASDIADLHHVVGLYGLLIVVLAVLFIICALLVGMLVYGKLHGHKHNELGDTVNNLEKNFNWRLSQSELKIENLKGTLQRLENTINDIQNRNSSEEKKTSTAKQMPPHPKEPSQQIQYLKAENNDGYFFEGDNKNSEGCQFKVIFHSKANGAKGELTIITNWENLKVIPSQFFRNVIKVTNGVNPKDAVSMKVIRPGICEYKLEADGYGTWSISRPIEIKLIKK